MRAKKDPQISKEPAGLEPYGIVQASIAAMAPVLTVAAASPMKIDRRNGRSTSSVATRALILARMRASLDQLAVDDPALTRIRGVRANASRMSHAELDESEVLDDGDPVELGGQLAGLHARRSHVSVLGGCCGTDHRHIAAIAAACRAG